MKKTINTILFVYFMRKIQKVVDITQDQIEEWMSTSYVFEYDAKIKLKTIDYGMLFKNEKVIVAWLQSDQYQYSCGMKNSSTWYVNNGNREQKYKIKHETRWNVR